ncbi:Hypothetical protein MexAM1_META2p0192 (plasmid) [Methylorubrum extorquens AM1]|uniref:Uncharacterized protein n=1 Tax=Methylorubrum extorquens (strain ATCC 14718 / DSM 1338 / JCM 2805 / NCIMB 9133 / AM1) TaxID=272630 RepID=C5B3S2_METEA|nr:Hypothetical protein MexAM1_META2p0192 [Methylorubrum extorquens AM1]
MLGPNPRMLSMMREEDFRRVDGRHPELCVPRIIRYYAATSPKRVEVIACRGASWASVFCAMERGRH